MNRTIHQSLKRIDSPPLAPIQPQHVLSFDPTEFAFTLQTIAELVHRPGLFNSPAQYGLNDCLENRIALAVSQHYRNERWKCFSFIYRWLALADLIQSGALDNWYARHGKRRHGIHENVIELAAWLPLTTKGRFARRPFISALNTITNQC